MVFGNIYRLEISVCLPYKETMKGRKKVLEKRIEVADFLRKRWPRYKIVRRPESNPMQVFFLLATLLFRDTNFAFPRPLKVKKVEKWRREKRKMRNLRKKKRIDRKTLECCMILTILVSLALL